MTTDDHELYASWAAAYTLGSLDADDRRSFEAHLVSCAVCASELAALAPLPALIARIDPDDVEREPDPVRAAAIGSAARAELDAVRRRGRRWQRSAAVLAAAVLVLIAMVVVARVDGDSDARPTQAARIASSEAASTDVMVSSRGWGTEITLDISGLPPRGSYQLWTIDTDGTWVSAATWLPTSSGAVRLTGASRTPTTDIERIVVTSNERDDLLVEAVPA